MVVVCPVRVPLFLKLDEAQKAGLLCQKQLFLESADLFVNRILAGGLHRLSLHLLCFLKGALLARALLGFLFFVWEILFDLYLKGAFKDLIHLHHEYLLLTFQILHDDLNASFFIFVSIFMCLIVLLSLYHNL